MDHWLWHWVNQCIIMKYSKNSNSYCFSPNFCIYLNRCWWGGVRLRYSFQTECFKSRNGSGTLISFIFYICYAEIQTKYFGITRISRRHNFMVTLKNLRLDVFKWVSRMVYRTTRTGTGGGYYTEFYIYANLMPSISIGK